MQRLLDRRTKDINERDKSHGSVLVMSYVLLGQVRMYALYVAINSWLPWAETKPNHKDCHSVLGVKLPRESSCHSIKAGLVWDGSNGVSPYRFSVHDCVL